MHNTQQRFIFTIIAVSLFLLGIFFAQTLDSDFGRVTVTAVSIFGDDKELSGLLYRPNSASADHPTPAIVLAHGISGSKEMMSSIGLELARRDFVVLCLDLFGHGKSDGTVGDGGNEPSFGVLSAVHYLKTQAFVNSSAIGLVGHSLGAGAVRATVNQDSKIGALVLIAGGLGDVAEGPAYGTLNSTFPKNLLVIVGKYDVLFNLTELAAKELPPVFGTQTEVVPGVLYGSFLSQTARKFVMPATTHLFEPVDPTVILETAAWMEETFTTTQPLGLHADANMIYPEREVAILAVLAGLFGIIFVAFFAVAGIVQPSSQKEIVQKEDSKLNDWKAYAIWGVLNLGLFLPMFGVGFVVPFPPLIFGASIAWWMLAVGLLGVILSVRTLPKSAKMRNRLEEKFLEVFDRNAVLVALILFTLLFVIASLLEGVFHINLRIISPIFRALTSARRVLAFLAFVPFFLAYFVAEGLYLHELLELKNLEQGARVVLHSYGKALVGKITPFVALILLQYVPKVFLDIWILPSFVGFLVEFLWLIVPIFIITTTCSWWLYRNTKNVATGAMFNALMMAWTASAVFPF